MQRQERSRNTTEAVAGKLAVLFPILPCAITGMVPELP
jgi:hypothetical protein